MRGNTEKANVVQKEGESRFVRWLYASGCGRRLLPILVSPRFAALAERLLDSKASRILIRPYVKKYGIDLNECRARRFVSFNDFFTRELRPERRPADADPQNLVSPSDGRLLAVPIDGERAFEIKNAEYSLRSLLKSASLAARFVGGTAVIIRLEPGDCHRYCYPADGQKSRNYKIRGVYHALAESIRGALPVYKENNREFFLLRTERFGTVVMMEVGAMFVGRISNFHCAKSVKKGEKAGCFDYGGSTIVLLLPGSVDVCPQFLDGKEHRVRMGEAIARIHD